MKPPIRRFQQSCCWQLSIQKIGMLGVIGLILLVACGTPPKAQTARKATLAASTTTAPTPTPTLTSDPGRVYGPANAYSLVPPANWDIFTFDNEDPAFIGPYIQDCKCGVSLRFNQEPSPLSAPLYATSMQDSLKASLPDLIQVGEEVSSTASGLEYLRWEFKTTLDGIVFNKIVYFFKSGENKLILIYSRPERYASENDALVDRAVKTLTLK